MLSEIKVRYEASCSKCQRTIRVGWTAYFQAEGKKVYCKPCGEKINKDENASPKPETNKSDERIDEILGVLDFHTNTLITLSDIVKNIKTDIEGLKLPIKPKSTKK